MKLQNSAAKLFIPDQADLAEALPRTTALCIAAHQDDIEIMAYAPIIECFGKTDKWFTGVTVTDGAGSPRSGVYENYTDENMKVVRAQEQKMAAEIGRYSAQFLLAYKSSEVKAPRNETLIDELREIILACSPKTLYTHNLADKHDTHVAVALNVIRALKGVPKEKRPEKVVSLEVWRSLDWLRDEDKLVLDTSAHPNVSAAILGVYDSQITGGKRYDLATVGRRLANATFFASHDVDEAESVTYGLDITELIDGDVDPCDFIGGYIDEFRAEINGRIAALS
ncbi:MAG: PIG-L family deacetylase [Oscillospiraceae bacterium]|nr:PIG-L family deacetylase [Oscillospiraceae bacterium]